MNATQIVSEPHISEEATPSSIYTKVTASIIEELKRGVRPWTKPWDDEQQVSLPRRFNGEAYTGINILMLWAKAETVGYINPTWLTFKQVEKLGGYVRKGEQRTTVVYASKFTKSEKDTDGTETEKEIFFLKQYSVFNAEQCCGLPSKFRLQKPKVESIQPIENAERFFRSLGADIRNGGNSACYCPDADFVRIPKMDDFRDAESYAATMAHELIHWTGHKSRLGRNFSGQRFGGYARAMEELVAEMGAAFLCADLNISPVVREDQINYIGSWLQIFENDHRAIFTAASIASRAVGYLHALAKNEPSLR